MRGNGQLGMLPWSEILKAAGEAYGTYKRARRGVPGEPLPSGYVEYERVTAPRPFPWGLVAVAVVGAFFLMRRR